jgi:hypothetical protein
VIDLRPLAAVAEPPEQVVVIDPANPLAIDWPTSGCARCTPTRSAASSTGR